MDFAIPRPLLHMYAAMCTQESFIASSPDDDADLCYTPQNLCIGALVRDHFDKGTRAFSINSIPSDRLGDMALQLETQLRRYGSGEYEHADLLSMETRFMAQVYEALPSIMTLTMQQRQNHTPSALGVAAIGARVDDVAKAAVERGEFACLEDLIDVVNRGRKNDGILAPNTIGAKIPTAVDQRQADVQLPKDVSSVCDMMEFVCRAASPHWNSMGLVGHSVFLRATRTQLDDFDEHLVLPIGAGPDDRASAPPMKKMQLLGMFGTIASSALGVAGFFDTTGTTSALLKGVTALQASAALYNGFSSRLFNSGLMDRVIGVFRMEPSGVRAPDEAYVERLIDPDDKIQPQMWKDQIEQSGIQTGVDDGKSLVDGISNAQRIREYDRLDETLAPIFGGDPPDAEHTAHRFNIKDDNSTLSTDAGMPKPPPHSPNPRDVYRNENEWLWEQNKKALQVALRPQSGPLVPYTYSHAGLDQQQPSDTSTPKPRAAQYNKPTTAAAAADDSDLSSFWSSPVSSIASAAFTAVGGWQTVLFLGAGAALLWLLRSKNIALGAISPQLNAQMGMNNANAQGGGGGTATAQGGKGGKTTVSPTISPVNKIRIEASQSISLNITNNNNNNAIAIGAINIYPVSGESVNNEVLAKINEQVRQQIQTALDSANGTVTAPRAINHSNTAVINEIINAGTPDLVMPKGNALRGLVQAARTGIIKHYVQSTDAVGPSQALSFFLSGMNMLTRVLEQLYTGNKSALGLLSSTRANGNKTHQQGSQQLEKSFSRISLDNNSEKTTKSVAYSTNGREEGQRDERGAVADPTEQESQQKRETDNIASVATKIKSIIVTPRQDQTAVGDALIKHIGDISVLYALLFICQGGKDETDKTQGLPAIIEMYEKWQQESYEIFAKCTELADTNQGTPSERIASATELIETVFLETPGIDEPYFKRYGPQFIAQLSSQMIGAGEGLIDNVSSGNNIEGDPLFRIIKPLIEYCVEQHTQMVMRWQAHVNALVSRTLEKVVVVTDAMLGAFRGFANGSNLLELINMVRPRNPTDGEYTVLYRQLNGMATSAYRLLRGDDDYTSKLRAELQMAISPKNQGWLLQAGFKNTRFVNAVERLHKHGLDILPASAGIHLMNAHITLHNVPLAIEEAIRDVERIQGVYTTNSQKPTTTDQNFIHRHMRDHVTIDYMFSLVMMAQEPIQDALSFYALSDGNALKQRDAFGAPAFTHGDALFKSILEWYYGRFCVRSMLDMLKDAIDNMEKEGLHPFVIGAAKARLAELEHASAARERAIERNASFFAARYDPQILDLAIAPPGSDSSAADKIELLKRTDTDKSVGLATLIQGSNMYRGLKHMLAQTDRIQLAGYENFKGFFGHVRNLINALETKTNNLEMIRVASVADLYGESAKDNVKQFFMIYVLLVTFTTINFGNVSNKPLILALMRNETTHRIIGPEIRDPKQIQSYLKGFIEFARGEASFLLQKYESSSNNMYFKQRVAMRIGTTPSQWSQRSIHELQRAKTVSNELDRHDFVSSMVSDIFSMPEHQPITTDMQNKQPVVQGTGNSRDNRKNKTLLDVFGGEQGDMSSNIDVLTGRDQSSSPLHSLETLLTSVVQKTNPVVKQSTSTNATTGIPAQPFTAGESGPQDYDDGDKRLHTPVQSEDIADSGESIDVYSQSQQSDGASQASSFRIDDNDDSQMSQEESQQEFKDLLNAGALQDEDYRTLLQLAPESDFDPHRKGSQPDELNGSYINPSNAFQSQLLRIDTYSLIKPEQQLESKLYLGVINEVCSAATQQYNNNLDKKKDSKEKAVKVVYPRGIEIVDTKGTKTYSFTYVKDVIMPHTGLNRTDGSVKSINDVLFVWITFQYLSFAAVKDGLSEMLQSGRSVMHNLGDIVTAIKNGCDTVLENEEGWKNANVVMYRASATIALCRTVANWFSINVISPNNTLLGEPGQVPVARDDSSKYEFRSRGGVRRVLSAYANAYDRWVHDYGKNVFAQRFLGENNKKTGADGYQQTDANVLQELGIHTLLNRTSDYHKLMLESMPSIFAKQFSYAHDVKTWCAALPGAALPSPMTSRDLEILIVDHYQTGFVKHLAGMIRDLQVIVPDESIFLRKLDAKLFNQKEIDSNDRTVHPYGVDLTRVMNHYGGYIGFLRQEAYDWVMNELISRGYKYVNKDIWSAGVQIFNQGGPGRDATKNAAFDKFIDEKREGEDTFLKKYVESGTNSKQFLKELHDRIFTTLVKLLKQFDPTELNLFHSFVLLMQKMNQKNGVLYQGELGTYAGVMIPKLKGDELRHDNNRKNALGSAVYDLIQREFPLLNPNRLPKYIGVRRPNTITGRPEKVSPTREYGLKAVMLIAHLIKTDVFDRMQTILTFTKKNVSWASGDLSTAPGTSIIDTIIKDTTDWINTKPGPAKDKAKMDTIHFVDAGTEPPNNNSILPPTNSGATYMINGWRVVQPYKDDYMSSNNGNGPVYQSALICRVPAFTTKTGAHAIHDVFTVHIPNALSKIPTAVDDTQIERSALTARTHMPSAIEQAHQLYNNEAGFVKWVRTSTRDSIASLKKTQGGNKARTTPSQRESRNWQYAKMFLSKQEELRLNRVCSLASFMGMLSIPESENMFIINSGEAGHTRPIKRAEPTQHATKPKVTAGAAGDDDDDSQQSNGGEAPNVKNAKRADRDKVPKANKSAWIRGYVQLGQSFGANDTTKHTVNHLADEYNQFLASQEWLYDAGQSVIRIDGRSPAKIAHMLAHHILEDTTDDPMSTIDIGSLIKQYNDVLPGDETVNLPLPSLIQGISVRGSRLRGKSLTLV